MREIPTPSFAQQAGALMARFEVLLSNGEHRAEEVSHFQRKIEQQLFEEGNLLREIQAAVELAEARVAAKEAAASARQAKDAEEAAYGRYLETLKSIREARFPTAPEAAA